MAEVEIMRHIGPYTPADQSACLMLLDSNTPELFAPSERPDFVAFIDEGSPAVLVIKVANALLAIMFSRDDLWAALQSVARWVTTASLTEYTQFLQLPQSIA